MVCYQSSIKFDYAFIKHFQSKIVNSTQLLKFLQDLEDHSYATIVESFLVFLHKFEFDVLLIASDNSLDFNNHISGCHAVAGLELVFYTQTLSAYKSFVVIFLRSRNK